MLGDRVGKKRKVLKDGKLPLNERYDLRFFTASADHQRFSFLLWQKHVTNIRKEFFYEKKRN